MKRMYRKRTRVRTKKRTRVRTKKRTRMRTKKRTISRKKHNYQNKKIHKKKTRNGRRKKRVFLIKGGTPPPVTFPAIGSTPKSGPSLTASSPPPSPMALAADARRDRKQALRESEQALQAKTAYNYSIAYGNLLQLYPDEANMYRWDDDLSARGDKFIQTRIRRMKAASDYIGTYIAEDATSWLDERDTLNNLMTHTIKTIARRKEAIPALVEYAKKLEEYADLDLVDDLRETYHTTTYMRTKEMDKDEIEKYTEEMIAVLNPLVAEAEEWRILQESRAAEAKEAKEACQEVLGGKTTDPLEIDYLYDFFEFGDLKTDKEDEIMDEIMHVIKDNEGAIIAKALAMSRELRFPVLKNVSGTNQYCVIEIRKTVDALNGHVVTATTQMLQALKSSSEKWPREKGLSQSRASRQDAILDALQTDCNLNENLIDKAIDLVGEYPDTREMIYYDFDLGEYKELHELLNDVLEVAEGDVRTYFSKLVSKMEGIKTDTKKLVDSESFLGQYSYMFSSQIEYIGFKKEYLPILAILASSNATKKIEVAKTIVGPDVFRMDPFEEMTKLLQSRSDAVVQLEAIYKKGGWMSETALRRVKRLLRIIGDQTSHEQKLIEETEEQLREILRSSSADADFAPQRPTTADAVVHDSLAEAADNFKWRKGIYPWEVFGWTKEQMHSLTKQNITDEFKRLSDQASVDGHGIDRSTLNTAKKILNKFK